MPELVPRIYSFVVGAAAQMLKAEAANPKQPLSAVRQKQQFGKRELEFGYRLGGRKFRFEAKEDRCTLTERIIPGRYLMGLLAKTPPVELQTELEKSKQGQAIIFGIVACADELQAKLKRKPIL